MPLSGQMPSQGFLGIGGLEGSGDELLEKARDWSLGIVDLNGWGFHRKAAENFLGSINEAMVAFSSMRTLSLLQQTISNCTRCPRLTVYRQAIAKEKVKRFREWDYWGRPVPGFGDPHARLFVVGLAPAAHGGNRTGRVFTGDRSGDWLYEALHAFGFANQPTSVHKEDGLKLKHCYVAAAVRCAPPANKPTKEEFEACRPFLEEEVRLLKKVSVVVALGRIAFEEYLRTCQAMGRERLSPRPKFVHGAEIPLPWGITLLGSYHPSQQNTFTGTLPRPMFHGIFRRARALAEQS
jgi:uracil-DNA glycosylase family 4